MTTVELSQTVQTVNQLDRQLLVAHQAMQSTHWHKALESLQGAMQEMLDCTTLRSFVESAPIDDSSQCTSILMFQEAPPGFRVDLMLQLARAAAARIEQGATDHARRDLDQLRTILELLRQRLAA